MEKDPARTRTLAFLVSGLMDCLLGGFLFLTWLGVLPNEMSWVDLPRPWAGLLGAVMTLSGVVVVTYQLTRLKEPGE